VGATHDPETVYRRAKSELRALLRRLDPDLNDPGFVETLPKLTPALIAVREGNECVYALFRLPKVLQGILSQREIEISVMVRDGLVNKVIARKLRISTRTVAAHLRSIYSKLSIDSRVHLAIAAMGLAAEIA